MRRKVNGQSSNTTAIETPSSGISKVSNLPPVLKYPRLLDFRDYGQVVKNLFCYVIRHYGKSGLSVLIYRQPVKDQVVVICGDWDGNHIDMAENSELGTMAKHFIDNHLSLFLNTMRLIKLEQVQLFFSLDEKRQLMLVDIQTSINKLSGPGMVRDVFGNKFNTQQVLKIEVLDDRAMECIADGSGSYAGDLIIKPTRFRHYHDMNDNSYIPMYVEVTR